MQLRVRMSVIYVFFTLGFFALTYGLVRFSDSIKGD